MIATGNGYKACFYHMTLLAWYVLSYVCVCLSVCHKTMFHTNNAIR